jgi:hypothetical protein
MHIVPLTSGSRRGVGNCPRLTLVPLDGNQIRARHRSWNFSTIKIQKNSDKLRKNYCRNGKKWAWRVTAELGGIVQYSQMFVYQPRRKFGSYPVMSLHWIPIYRWRRLALRRVVVLAALSARRVYGCGHHKTQQNIPNKTFSVVRREVGGSSQTLYVPSDCSRSLYSDSSETPLETMIFINSA